MKKIATTIILLLGTYSSGSACPLCNKNIMDGIYNGKFYPNIILMLSLFTFLGAIVMFVSSISAKKHYKRISDHPNLRLLTPVPLTAAAMVLGIGMGGFIDGIVLHQIFQVHSMISNIIPATEYIGKSVNMFWDGIFHFLCMIAVLTGILLLWKIPYKKDVDLSGKLLGGGLLLGWGLLNIVEGVLNHHILKLHNVIEISPDHDNANFIFLGISVMMMILGSVIVKNHSKQIIIYKLPNQHKRQTRKQSQDVYF